jgi:hypothetical protein
MRLARRLAAIAAFGVCLLASSAGPVLGADTSPSPAATPAVPNLGLGVGNSDVILKVPDEVLDPDVRSGSFAVYNAGDVEMTVTASAFDLTVDANGHRTPTADPVALGAAAWLTIDEPTFTLKPNGSRTVAFSATVPKEASPGDHFAGIKVLGRLSDAASARLQAQLGSGTSVQSQIEFPVTVVVRVPGEVKNDLKPGDGTGGLLSPFFNSWGGDIEFAPRIVNDGNVAAIWSPTAGKINSLDDLVPMVPTLRLVNRLSFFGGDALLFEGRTGEKGDINVSQIIVLPGESKTLRFLLKDPPLISMYDYTFTLPGSDPVAAVGMTGDGRPAVTATGSVTVVNFEKVALWIVLPIVVVLLLIAFLLFWRWRQRRNARKAAEAKERERVQMKAQAREEVLREQAAAQAPQTDEQLQAAIAAEEARLAAQEHKDQT